MPEGLSAAVSARTADFQSGMRAARESLGDVRTAAGSTAFALGRTEEQMDDTRNSAVTMATAVGTTGVSFNVLSTSATGSVAALSVLSGVAAGLATTLVPLTATLGGLATATTAVAGAFGAVVGSGLVAFGKERGAANAERLEQIRSQIRELEALKEKRRELRKALEETAAVTAKRETLNNIRGRIEELERLIKLESERYNEALRIIEELEGVVTRRVEILEGELERVFSDEGLPISFSMFTRKLNGELAENCEIIYGGRSFDNLSNGEQLAIGYRLSERLKLLLGIVTPTFIDNYEALTIEVSGEAGQKFLAEVSPGELQTFNL